MIKKSFTLKLTYNVRHILHALVGLLMTERQRPLKVFLCHASGDKPAVRALYQRLIRDGVDAWLDREKLLPGQDWQLEIPKAVRESDVVIVCLSNKSITKEGYVQKEIKFALDIATEKPEGTIFLIPARLEECNVPLQFASWQWVDLFESDGYERLMRSLRLRADKLGMQMGDIFYTDRELEQRLDQLYTEGLAALWVEDWDKAYHRFQTILREKPDHMQAIAKLDEAKRQKHLHALYTQALDAQEHENWDVSVDVLEKLTSEASDYKDAAVLLKNARKKNQLAQLYQEAQRLYKAQQWQAVVRVFSQIVAIEPSYHDPGGLLPSAEKEVAELKRIADLNALYSRGVREMDAGKWYEARTLLEQVHKAQKGFLETERLLRKVEDEIVKIEELKQRNIQVNTLYEQAHELIRSKNWRKAVDKIEEIQKLDNQFVDKDGILDQARAKLDHEEEVVRRQNELAAKYTEAVRLLKEAKYQEALDKWQEVKAIDPKYPDRQMVQRIAKKKLAENAKAPASVPRVSLNTPALVRILGILAALTVVAVFIILLGNRILFPPSASSSVTYDNFDDLAYEDKLNTSIWKAIARSPNYAKQQEGVMELSVTPNSEETVSLMATQKLNMPQLGFVESEVLLSGDRVGKGGDVSLQLMTNINHDQNLILWCGISRSVLPQTWCEVYGRVEGKTEYSSKKITTNYDIWHTFRIELSPEAEVFFYIDGLSVGSYLPSDAELLKTKSFTVRLEVWDPSQEGIKAHFDNVWIEQNQ